MRELPLFPLNLVLFPGATLPLHIFEERYKIMIGRCLQEKLPFGVALIRAGREAGGPAETFPVGTLARILHVERLSGGRLNIITMGTSRFKIVEELAGEPYLRGLLEDLPEELASGAGLGPLAEEVRRRFTEYVDLVRQHIKEPPKELQLPEEPMALSYFIGSTLQVPPPEQQRLLETSRVEARLKRELALISKEMAMVRYLGASKGGGSVGPFSTN